MVFQDSIDPKTFSEDDRNSLLSFAFERYFQGRVIIGTPDTCRETIKHLQKIGVDEIACLIDFGLDFDSIIKSLCYLKDLKIEYKEQRKIGNYSELSVFG